MPAGGGCCTCSPATTSAREGCGRCAAAGQTGPPRAGEDRAAAALDARHRLDPLPCGVCERRRVPDIVLCCPEEVGLVIRPAIAGPLPDIESLAGADDLPTCAPPPAGPPGSRSGWPTRSPRPTPTAAGYAGPTCD